VKIDRWPVVRRRLPVVLATLAALCAAAPSATAATAARCGVAGYSYAGVASAQAAPGAAATVTALRAPGVEHGHVAAWIGGAGMGPRGSDEWLQAGLVARPGGSQRLYVEWKRPGSSRGYLELAGSVAVGDRHRLAVRELDGRPSVWRAYVDGAAVGPAVRLPGSHGRFPAVATAESWDGGRPSCNRFAFRFAALWVAQQDRGALAAPAFVRIQDPGYRVEMRERATFVARSNR
jgi:hypothetical protein